MTDIVVRLRDPAPFARGDDLDIRRNCLEAADEIKQLRELVKKQHDVIKVLGRLILEDEDDV